jgi:RNA polymerase subunit RPABC4/transcription elongation factor Spt4
MIFTAGRWLKALSVSICGKTKIYIIMALINCPECNKEVSDKADMCPNCGYPINGSIKMQPLPEARPENLMKCPICKSTQLTSNKKGFSGGKAAAGAILTGGIGLLAGTIGSGKIIISDSGIK